MLSVVERRPMVPAGVAAVTNRKRLLEEGRQLWLVASNNAAPGSNRRADRRQRGVLVSPGGCAPVLAHVPSFGRNSGGTPDFLAYPVPIACMQVLGTGVPRCLGVAPSASSLKAAQALVCSLTPEPRIKFGRVTWMARAASVPWLWTLGFLLLCGASVWVWVSG